ncbi:histidine kinase [Longibacter salinarum]|uniref:Histidine kinase n=1 Tax=Longibacter salinarum TaxID=1850348 RepID=A0A2A8CWL3_9BACT|nr:CBS domain-containing protein [Longibacter salinarum]PEN13013.1 histidine kinase [Longibacter salinarum]
MYAREILKRKGTGAVTIAADELIATSVNLLSKHNIGALVVERDGKLVGILDERDIIRRLATEGTRTLSQSVREVMKQTVVTCSPDEGVKDMMSTMTRRRIRHLPVLEDGVLVGIVSIGDLLKSRLEEVETEQSVLRERLLAR